MTSKIVSHLAVLKTRMALCEGSRVYSLRTGVDFFVLVRTFTHKKGLDVSVIGT